jgi:hypothetical protein
MQAESGRSVEIRQTAGTPHGRKQGIKPPQRGSRESGTWVAARRRKREQQVDRSSASVLLDSPAALIGLVRLIGKRMPQRGTKMAGFGPGRSVLIQPKDRNLSVKGGVDSLTKN